ncbi:MAG: alpha/beta hydrolase [Eubacteriales bacterium]
MIIKQVDLYKELNREKLNGSKGLLTMYLPDNYSEINEERKRPAILIMPGGGYILVSPGEAEPIAMRYLARGFAVFILDYAVAPAKYPTAFLEAAMAMIYIREYAEIFNVHKEKIAALGFSAGGHLCGCLATLFGEDVIKEAFGEKSSMAKPNAAILSYPVITSKEKGHQGSFENLCGDDEELKKYLSLEDRVTPQSVPAFIWHTYEDGAVPVYNCLAMAQSYEKNRVPFSLHIFEKGQHGLSTADGESHRTDELPAVSTNLTRWIDMSIDWLEDRGIKTAD